MVDYRWSDYFAHEILQRDGYVTVLTEYWGNSGVAKDFLVDEIASDEGRVDLFLPKDGGSVTVQVSGGADSAILLYSLAKKVQEIGIDLKIHPLTYVRDKPHNLISAPGVVEWIQNRLGFKFEQHLIVNAGREDKMWNDRLRARRQTLSIKHNIIMEYDAQSSLPGYPGPVPEEARRDLDHVISALGERISDPETRIKELGVYASSHYLKKPFWFKDKAFIASLYKTHDVLDLLPHTRSCESLPHQNENYKLTCFNSKYLTERGHQCWWCTERKWAFAKYDANYQDFKTKHRFEAS